MDRSWLSTKESMPATILPRGFVLRSTDSKRSMRESSGTVAAIASLSRRRGSVLSCQVFILLVSECIPLL
jgi:hypothetical protein